MKPGDNNNYGNNGSAPQHKSHVEGRLSQLDDPVSKAIVDVIQINAIECVLKYLQKNTEYNRNCQVYNSSVISTFFQYC